MTSMTQTSTKTTIQTLQADKALAVYTPGSAAWQQAAREAATKTAKTLQRTYIQLGGYLYEISKTHVDDDITKPLVYKSWGYETLGEYYEKELGIHERKAEFLMRIYRVLFEDLKSIPESVRAKIVDLDYSKVRELVAVLTPDNVYEWVDVLDGGVTWGELTKAIGQYKQTAKNLGMFHKGKVITNMPPVVQMGVQPSAPSAMQKATATTPPKSDPSDHPQGTATPASSAPKKTPPPSNVIALPTKATTPPAARGLSAKAALDAVKKAETDKGTTMQPTLEETPSTKFVAYLYPDQAKLVKSAMDSAQKLANSDKPGHLLTLICMDYLATNGAVIPGSAGFVNYLSNLENIYSVDFIALDRTASKPTILAGKAHLLRLLKMMDDALGADDTDDSAADEPKPTAPAAEQAPPPADLVEIKTSDNGIEGLETSENDIEDDEVELVGSASDPFLTPEEEETLRLAGAADTPEELDELINSMAVGDYDDVTDEPAQGEELFDD